MSREAFDRWRKQYELTELLPYGITIDHDEKELMWQAWQHQQAEIDRLKEDKRLMTLNQEKIDGLLAERGAELERLKEENKRLDSYAARINRICSGHEKEKEALQQRNSELEKALKILHEDCCYQLSDDIAHYHPDRPSAKTFKLVEQALGAHPKGAGEDSE